MCVALAAFTACSDDAEPAAVAVPVPVSLSPAVSEATLTRADGTLVEGTAFADDAVIGLYAYSATGLLAAATTAGGVTTYSAGTGRDYNLADAAVTVGGSALSYPTNRYWPADQVTFWAYYPKVSAVAPAAPATGTGIPATLAITMPANAASQPDLLVSDVKSYTLTNTGTGLSPLGGTVPLVFHHALAQLRFYVLIDIDEDGIWWDATAGQPISFKGRIELSGLHEQATLTLGTAGTNEWGGHAWGSYGGILTSFADPVSWTKVNAAAFSAAAFSPNDYTITNSEKMLVLPATYTAASVPTMAVAISDTRSDIDENDRNGTVTLSVGLPLNLDSDNDGTNDQLMWRPGYIYNYYFVIELGKTVKGYYLTPLLEAEQW